MGKAISAVNIPDGDHDEVLFGKFRDAVETWNEIASNVDGRVVAVYGARHGDIRDVAAHVAYAHVAKAASMMANLSLRTGSSFDPVLFAERCLSIAREQLARAEAEHELSDVEDDPARHASGEPDADRPTDA